MRRIRIIFYSSFWLSVSCSQLACNHPIPHSKPNIVFIYIDDLGYGDVSCYGAKAVKTPNVDFLASNGLRFTDAHCSASTCTPSRYSLLTGNYAFRNNAKILPGDAPLLIDPAVETMPAMFQKAGYSTAVIGKWHLGLGRGIIDWNHEIAPGPLEIGFGYSFILPATTDRVPCVYVENHRVYGLDSTDPIAVSYRAKIGNEPTGLSDPGLLKMAADTQHSNTIINGISRIGYMQGGRKARWIDEDIADILTSKAKAFIGANKNKPFFLYFSVPDIHVPRTPHARFTGTTTMGRRGDVISEMDWMTGEIRKALEESGIEKNTLVIFSSDNGPVLDDGYMDQAEERVGSHEPSGIYRGGKYSAYEGGTRVSTIAYWRDKINPGISSAVFSQVDLFASLAKLIGQPLAKDAGNDSEDMLDVILGKSQTGRTWLLEEAFTLGIRKGNWKYIAPQEAATPDWLENKKIETGLMPTDQLFNLEADPTETDNIAAKYPEIVKELKAELIRIKTVKSTGNH
jgi:arylsulfatase A-like enzyme